MTDSINDPRLSLSDGPAILLVALTLPLVLHAQLPASKPVGDLSFNLSDVGVAGTGGDDTNVFQSALKLSAVGGGTLVIPASQVPYIVGPLSIASNTSIVFDPGVIIQARSGFESSDRLLSIVGVSNVHIQGHGTVFRMNKAEYTSGESRHCLDIEGSSDITVDDISCNGSGGDGLYIGAGKRGYSQNITVTNSSFSDNRRQGMSITSGLNITVARCNFLRTQGTAPGDGIDIEPNSATDQLVNILIQDSTTSANAGNGVAIDVRNLDSTSNPVSIDVERHTSSGNVGSGYFVTNDSSGAPGPPGSILINASSSSFESQYGAVASYYNSAGPAVTFSNLTVIDPNQGRTTYDNSAVSVKRGGGGRGLIGNVSFSNLTVSGATGTLDTYFSLWDYSYVGFSKIHLNPSSFTGAKMGTGLIQGHPSQTVNIP